MESLTTTNWTEQKTLKWICAVGTLCECIHLRMYVCLCYSSKLLGSGWSTRNMTGTEQPCFKIFVPFPRPYLSVAIWEAEWETLLPLQWWDLSCALKSSTCRAGFTLTKSHATPRQLGRYCSSLEKASFLPFFVTKNKAKWWEICECGFNELQKWHNDSIWARN